MAHSATGYVGTQDDVVLARVGAFILDYFLSLALGAAVGFGFAMALDSVIGIYLGVPAGLLGYYVLLEGVFGQTVGKRLTGIVVVTESGGPISFGQALTRNLLRVVDGLFNYALGLVVMLLSREMQRVGDHAAGTIVVRARR